MPAIVYLEQRNGDLTRVGEFPGSGDDAILEAAKQRGLRGTFVAYDIADGTELTIR